MGDHDTTRKFESGLIGWVLKWRGFLTLFSTMVALAFGGYDRIHQIELSIDRLALRMDEIDRRLPVVESASSRDREALVRLEVQVLNLNTMLQRIDAKLDRPMALK